METHHILLMFVMRIIAISIIAEFLVYRIQKTLEDDPYDTTPIEFIRIGSYILVTVCYIVFHFLTSIFYIFI